MTTKFVQMRNPLLKITIDGNATEAVFTEFVDLNGNNVTQADFGTVGYGTLEPNTDREEAISFVVDSNVDGEATLTITRGLLGKQPYGTGGPTYAHQAQSELVISNNPDLLNKLTAKDNDEEVSGSWKFPTTPVHAQNPVTKSHLESVAVLTTGAQSVAGVKTFTDKPVVPVATEAGNPIRKDTYDSTAVKLTGDQTVAGVKTFSSSPIIPDATTAQQPISKAQFDAAGASFSATASTTVRGTTKIDTTADNPADPVALTATADRVAALAGGGAFGTPSTSNKFLTEDFLDSVIDVQEFTASGTWTKPAIGKIAFIQVWGAGAGGGIAHNNVGTTSPNYAIGGSGGGGYFEGWAKLSELNATESVVVGAGGASRSSSTQTAVAGNPGGNSSFASIYQANGGGVSSVSGGSTNGGAGGSSQFYPSDFVGAGGTVGVPGGNGYLGGAGGGYGSSNGSTVGGNSLYGGAGSGGAYVRGSGPTINAANGGTSVYGGNAGNSVANGAGPATAQDGVAPGGAGGNAVAVGAGNAATSGKGGDGFVRITVF